MCEKAMLVLCNCFTFRQTVFWLIMVTTEVYQCIFYQLLESGNQIYVQYNSDMQAKYKACLLFTKFAIWL